MPHTPPVLVAAGLLIAPFLTPTPSGAQLALFGQATGTIIGIVHAADGAALPNAQVTAYPGPMQALDAVGPVQADNAGRYSISVPPARYTVVAKLDGYTQLTLDVFDMQSVPEPQARDVVLHPNDALVTGTVTDGDSSSAVPAGTIVDLVVQPHMTAAQVLSQRMLSRSAARL
jgi:Carboxypeptidase regulatory-like domain